MNDISRKNKIAILFFGLCAGAGLGLFAWAYLHALNRIMFFVWSWLPNRLHGLMFSVYILIICMAGSLLVGAFHKRWGDYPKNIQDTMREIKSNKKFSYGNLQANVLGAFLPLVFGGCVGPEAGLLSTLTGLFHWVSDCVQHLIARAETGSQTILACLQDCLTPGLLPQKTVCVKRKRADGSTSFLPTVVWIVMGVVGLTVFIVMFSYASAESLLARLRFEPVTARDAAFYLLLVAAGMLLGLFNKYLNRGFSRLFMDLRQRRMHVLNALVGGVIMAVVAQFFYIDLFSGEAEMASLIEHYGVYSGVFFIVLGLLKICLTNVCLATGWKGGNFIPIIFSGICIGYGFSVIFGVGGTFAAAIVTVCALSVACGMPLVMAVMLLAFMPLNTLPWMLIASILCGALPGKCRTDIQNYIKMAKKLRDRRAAKAAEK